MLARNIRLYRPYMLRDFEGLAMGAFRVYLLTIITAYGSLFYPLHIRRGGSILFYSRISSVERQQPC